MTSAPDENAAPGKFDRLTHFPISFFAVVMGMAGLTIASHKVESFANLGTALSNALFWLTAAIYLAIAAVYLGKFMLRRQAVVMEWTHPVRIAFFPAISIGIILLSVAALGIDAGLSRILWIVGTLMHFVFTVMVITAWISHARYEVIHLSPAWFIPVVGNIIVPIAGIHFAPADVSWFFYAFGIVFWLVLLTIVFNRLIFHNPLPARLMPTLFILIAPPAVGFLSWGVLTGELDAFGRILFFSAEFFFVLMLPQIGKFAKLPFALSWWATSFPIAALTIAHFAMAERSGNEIYATIGYVLFALLVLIIVGLLIKTVTAMMRGEICVPEK